MLTKTKKVEERKKVKKKIIEHIINFLSVFGVLHGLQILCWAIAKHYQPLYWQTIQQIWGIQKMFFAGALLIGLVCLVAYNALFKGKAILLSFIFAFIIPFFMGLWLFS